MMLFSWSIPKLKRCLKAKLGQPMELPFADIILIENSDFIPAEEEDLPELVVKFSNMESVVSNYRAKLQINLTDKNSSLIELGLDDAVKAKAQDILDQLDL